MQDSQAAKAKSVLGSAGGALILLALGVPVMAVAGVETLCVGDDAESASLEVPVEQFSIQLTDHGAANTVVAKDLEAAETTSTTDLAVPALNDNSTQPLETDEADASSEDIGPPTANTRFPGVSDEDSRRYRRQMYRTDI